MADDPVVLTPAQQVEAALLANALAPLRERQGDRSMEERTTPDLLALLDRLTGEVAATRDHLGLRFIKIIPPGCG
jgi:hypothetical protein